MIIELFYFLLAIPLLMCIISFLLFVTGKSEKPQIFTALAGLFFIVIGLLSFFTGLEIKSGHIDILNGTTTVITTYTYTDITGALTLNSISYSLFGLGMILFLGSLLSLLKQDKEQNPEKEHDY